MTIKLVAKIKNNRFFVTLKIAKGVFDLVIFSWQISV